MKKIFALWMAAAMLMGLFSGGCAEDGDASKTVIGIAWCADVESEFFTNIGRAIEAVGGSWVMLNQDKSPDLIYDAQGRLECC